MAADVKSNELINSGSNTFSAIELRGVVYFFHTSAAKDISTKLNEQLVFSPSYQRVTEFLEGVSAFVVDVANGNVVKPTP